MKIARIAVIVFAIGSFTGCSLHGQARSAASGVGPALSGPTKFSNNQNGVDFGEVAIVPDDTDDVSGIDAEAGPQMHFRLSRAYCDKRATSRQSASDQASLCAPDAVTIDDSHPPSSTPNKDFLIVPYAYGMNMEYPGGIEINSTFLGIHPNHSRCSKSQTSWLSPDSCSAAGNLWAEDNDDVGGVFATSYDVLQNGTIDRSRSFVMIASDTYWHGSHGDMLFTLRHQDDNFRFQFGLSGLGDNPETYKGYTRARIDSSGKGFFDGGTQVGGADFAESVATLGAKTNYEPGDVLVIDTDSDRRFSLSTSPYSTLAAGVYSTRPGVVGSRYSSEDPKLASEVPMAMTGIVPCKVSAENGPISRGDLLVTSSSAGYAMRGTDNAKLAGAIIGKALQPWPSGKGQIEVLVTLR